MGRAEASTRSLLLVEENDVILESLRDWLKMTFPNIRLLEANDHSSGVFLSRSESPDVILMDISGFGRGGVELVRSMKTAHPSGIVMALVTLEHDSYHQDILKAGADACGCIWKIRTELLPKLRNSLTSRRGPRRHSAPIH